MACILVFSPPSWLTGEWHFRHLRKEGKKSKTLLFPNFSILFLWIKHPAAPVFFPLAEKGASATVIFLRGFTSGSEGKPALLLCAAKLNWRERKKKKASFFVRAMREERMRCGSVKSHSRSKKMSFFCFWGGDESCMEGEKLPNRCFF